MCKFSSIFFAALCISFSSAENACAQRTIVNMPGNGAQPYYWPSTWNENQTAPQLKSHQSCSWTVTIPQGYYVKLIIDGKTTDKDSKFQIIDSAGNLIQSTKENKEPWYFPFPRITITATTEKPAHFAFKLIWAPIPVNAPGVIAGIGHMPEVFNASNTVYYDVYSANQVSIFPFPSDPSNILSYRSAIVFDGYNLQGAYRTNLYLAAQNGEQLISNAGNSFLVFNVEATPDSQDQILVQDYDYLKDFAQYSKLWCPLNTPCTASLSGGAQKSALVTIQSTNQTLTDVTIDDDATLSIYYGALNDFGFARMYNATELRAAVPVTFYGIVTQYVLSRGKADFTFNFH